MLRAPWSRQRSCPAAQARRARRHCCCRRTGRRPACRSGRRRSPQPSGPRRRRTNPGPLRVERAVVELVREQRDPWPDDQRPRRHGPVEGECAGLRGRRGHRPVRGPTPRSDLGPPIDPVQRVHQERALREAGCPLEVRVVPVDRVVYRPVLPAEVGEDRVMARSQPSGCRSYSEQESRRSDHRRARPTAPRLRGPHTDRPRSATVPTKTL